MILNLLKKSQSGVLPCCIVCSLTRALSAIVRSSNLSQSEVKNASQVAVAKRNRVLGSVFVLFHTHSQSAAGHGELSLTRSRLEANSIFFLSVVNSCL